ncbi:MAG: glutathionyl-hydroquinone reductase [Solirubrobacteraceae bacterium]|nr:glutathionyl-hydroquinone reductase [Solirubrobacteraceae bacterium]
MTDLKIDRALTALAANGAFERPPSQFRDWVSADGSTPFPAEAGRYHLYVSWACPWAHRTVIGRRLKGLEDVIGLSTVDPIRDERSWAFTGGEYTDPVNGFGYLSQAYAATNPDYEGRISVPVLWDKETGRIVNNESADILRMFSTGFGGLADDAVDLYPDAHRDEIDALNTRLYDDVNNAVYRAGFSRDQADYEDIVARMFATLDDMEERLRTRRFLFGDAPVEADWRLFTTLVRFDAVYNIHFKCSLRRVVDHPSLWAYTRDLYQQPGIAETVRFGEIRDHYYRTHGQINPSGLVAVQPAADFDAPHGRGSADQ